MPVNALQFPFAIIDFEASSLSDERSYPIEVGVAVAPATGAPILVWSSLIRPTAAWIATGQWSTRSEAVHGIATRELAEGLPPAEIARALNRIAAEVPVLWCDGGEYDAHWLRRLFAAARVEPVFRLSDISDLPGLDELARTTTPHRAGADAARLCAAAIIAYGSVAGQPHHFDNAAVIIVRIDVAR